MTTIILVMNCSKYAHKRELIRHTWAAQLRQYGIETYYIEGGHQHTALVGDVLRVAAPDDYANILTKLMKAYQFVLAHVPADVVVKVDDDVVLNVGMLVKYINRMSSYSAAHHAYLWDAKHMIGAANIHTREGLAFISSLPIPSSWSNAGVHWPGLKENVNEAQRDTVVPDDWYISEEILKANRVVQPLPPMVFDNETHPDKLRYYLVVHDIKTAERFIQIHTTINT